MHEGALTKKRTGFHFTGCGWRLKASRPAWYSRQQFPAVNLVGAQCFYDSKTPEK